MSQQSPVAPPTPTAEPSPRRTLIIGVLFGLAASAAYGSAQVLTRQGNGSAPPLTGTAIALFWGTLGFALMSMRNLRAPAEHFRRGAIFFVLGGIFSAMGVLLMFFALAQGQVVAVAPVLATNPLFTLLFASLLLRGVERITPRIVLGALLVVAGVVTLSVF